MGIYSTKVTLLYGGRVLANVVHPAELESAECAGKKAIDKAMKISGISKNSYYTVVTGQGKSLIPSADETISDGVCLARGIYELMPSVHTILDLGIQKSLAVKCSGGYPNKIISNDKCASGAGSFLQVVSDVLEIPVERMGEISLKSTEAVEINSTCAVFAESEIISLLHTGKKLEDILGGVYQSLAMRLYSLLLRVGIDRELALVGGIAKDKGLGQAIEAQIGHKILVPEQALFVGSLGAAIIGQEKVGA
ncbi:MAG: acyl-CoA dehydratase activase [Deltaproteobacteria bacterium]